MVPRRILTVLVYTLPLAAVVCAVLAGAALVADAIGDATARHLLRGAAGLAFLVLTTDLILLVTVLGLRALEQSPPDE